MSRARHKRERGGGTKPVWEAGGGTNAVIQFNKIRAGSRGVQARSTKASLLSNQFTGEYSGSYGISGCTPQGNGRNDGCSSAIEFDFMTGGTIQSPTLS